MSPEILAWMGGVVAGLGWGLLVGGMLGARWMMSVATEAVSDEDAQ